MKKSISKFLTVALCLWGLAASASSHREAPLIANDPLADNTDVYAFVSPALEGGKEGVSSSAD